MVASHNDLIDNSNNYKNAVNYFYGLSEIVRLIKGGSREFKGGRTKKGTWW